MHILQPGYDLDRCFAYGDAAAQRALLLDDDGTGATVNGAPDRAVPRPSVRDIIGIL